MSRNNELDERLHTHTHTHTHKRYEQTNESEKRAGGAIRPNFKWIELASHYQVLSSEPGMYHLLIERVSTVTSEFLQYQARLWIRLNRTGIEWVVERTNLFISLGLIYISHDYVLLLHGILSREMIFYHLKTWLLKQLLTFYFNLLLLFLLKKKTQNHTPTHLYGFVIFCIIILIIIKDNNYVNSCVMG